MDIQKILADHALWLAGNGGQRANLSRANLSHADLYNADLSRANLSHADLYNADLSRADLSHANLSHANLSGANLSDANLSGANLSGANLSDARGFAPTMILLVQWGNLSDTLCRLAMAYDASAHHDPIAFDRWKETGRCPYADTSYQRVCNFRERRDLWDPTIQAPRTWDLMVALIREKCANSDWHDKK